MRGTHPALWVDRPGQSPAGGWQLAHRPGRDSSRAAGYWSQDLDTLEEVATGYQGVLKVQVCGPVTLAAMLELNRRLDPALSDPGAFVDLTASLAEALAAHVADLRRRGPGAQGLRQPGASGRPL